MLSTYPRKRLLVSILILLEGASNLWSISPSPYSSQCFNPYSAGRGIKSFNTALTSKLGSRFNPYSAGRGIKSLRALLSSIRSPSFNPYSAGRGIKSELSVLETQLLSWFQSLFCWKGHQIPRFAARHAALV